MNENNIPGFNPANNQNNTGVGPTTSAQPTQQPVSPMTVPIQPEPVSPMTAPVQPEPVSPMTAPVQQPVSPMTVPVQPEPVSPMTAPVQPEPVSPMTTPVQPEPVSQMATPVQPEPVSQMATPVQNTEQPEITVVNPLNTEEKIDVPKTVPTAAPTAEPTNTPEPKQKKKNNMLIPIVAIIAIIAVGASVYFTFFAGDDEKTDTPDTPTVNVEETVAKVIKNMEELDSITMNFDAEMIISEDGVSMTMGIEGMMSNDLKNGLTYSDMKTNMFGMEIDAISYSKEVNGITTTYTKNVDSDWEVTTGGDSDSVMLDFGEFTEMLEQIDYESKQEGNKLILTLMIPSEDISGGLTENSADEIPVTMVIENDYITSVSVDFEEDENKLKMLIEMSDFNTDLNIEIPQEALDAE